METACEPARLVGHQVLLKKETATGFWTRAQSFFARVGITVERVLTDNGSCYRSRDWHDLPPEAGIAHKRTRPYRPQTNGKVERFNRTLLDEWAYTRPYRSGTERREAFPGWLHTYNHHRGHTALKGQRPASRAPNLPGQYAYRMTRDRTGVSRSPLEASDSYQAVLTGYGVPVADRDASRARRSMTMLRQRWRTVC